MLYGFTTNDAESFNALIAKTIGHKAFHFAKKGDYKSRVNVATISSLTGETFAPVCQAMNKQVPVLGQKLQAKRAEKNGKR